MLLPQAAKLDRQQGQLSRPGRTSRQQGRDQAALVQWFVGEAERACKAGVDGIELHSGNGYLFTQFLSSAINDRTDEYDGSLKGRAEFLIEVIRAIRDKVGDRLFLMVKLSAVERDNAIFRWRKPGNTLEESTQIAQWAEMAGADAIHVSTGSLFPHPRNPAGAFPVEAARRNYATILASGNRTLRNETICCSAICPGCFFGFGSRTKRISCGTAKSFPSAWKVSTRW